MGNALSGRVRQRILSALLFISAICISFSAEFFSIYGLSKVFSGEAVFVIILASCLGLAKLTMVGFLHEWWKKFSDDQFWIISKFILLIFVSILVTITSAGVYGFLSSAYQETADRDLISTRKIQLIENKKTRIAEIIDDLKKERDQVNSNIQTLTKSLSTDNQYQYIDKKTGQLVTNIQKTNKKGIELQLSAENDRRSVLNYRISQMVDSVQNYDIQILEYTQNNQSSSELGPLRYISTLTGVEMNRVINFFIILLVIVVDPLAIFLLVSALYSSKSNLEIKLETKEIPQDLTPQDIPDESMPISDPLPPEESTETVLVRPNLDPITLPRLKRKRGRPRKARRIQADSIVPHADESKLMRTVIENDLSSEVMKHLTDSLPKKKV